MSAFLYEYRLKFFGDSIMDAALLDEMAEEFEALVLPIREEFEHRFNVQTELET